MTADISAQQIDCLLEVTQQGDVRRDTVLKTLRAFTDRVGLPPLTFDASDTAGLALGEELQLHLALPSAFPGLLAIALMDIDVDERDRLAPLLLKLNRSWADTGGGIFTRIPPHHDILLCRQMTVIPENDAQLERDLLNFVRSAQQWQGTLRDMTDLPDDAFEALTSIEPDRDDEA
ncbi:MAG: CesT family type III secretion system chaperone [Pseudomonadota bacterium]